MGNSASTTKDSVEAVAGDLFDNERFRHGCPHEAYARARSECPVGWISSDRSENGGVWAVTRRDDVAAVSKDGESFSSGEKGIFLDPNQFLPIEVTRNVLLYKDPPEHTRYRTILQSAFTPRTVAKMEDGVRARAGRLLDEVIEQGSCDFVESVSVPLPLGVLAELLVIPEEEIPKLYDWTERIEQSQRDPKPSTGIPIFEEMAPYLLEHTQAQLAKGEENLITRLGKAEVDGRPINEMEITTFLALLVFAGNDTTRNTASGGLLALMENRDQWEYLCQHPGAIENAIEEILRYTSVVRWFKRTAKNDVEIGGQEITAGEEVVMFYSSASRDESKYEDPDRLDVTRTEHDHAAFGGGGRHFCMGSGLARLELRVLFEELTRRMPDVKLAGDPGYLASSWAGGITKLPIEFSPGAREGAGQFTQSA